ncbi:MAG: leucine-rich repeat protein [Lachnospiraceae bacterium]|nr:leucine-rich repeat protein [Lachnospiraceae bacterium]
MRKLRKTISFLLVLALVWGLVPTSYAEPEEVLAVETPTGPTSETCGADITWELTIDDEAEWDLAQGQPYKLTLTGSGEMTNYTAQNKAPWYEYCAMITSVSIEEGITSIGNFSFFNCVSLKSLTLPNSVAVIGSEAFNGCKLLETVVCGTGLKTIGTKAFSGNSKLNSIQLNEGLETIGKSAFYYCRNLASVSFPNSLVAVKDKAFELSGLTSIAIPENVSELGVNIVYLSDKLQSISVAENNTSFRAWDNVLYQLSEDGTPYQTLAYAYASGSGTVQIAEQTEKIGHSTFYKAAKVTSVILADTIKEIGEDSFYQTNIEYIDFPESLEKIGNTAFVGCKNLKEIHIPDQVQSIGTYAFWLCEGIKTITVGKGLQSLNGYIIMDCIALDTITISKENPYLDVIDNVVYNKDHTTLYLYAPAKTEETYYVLDTVRSIGDYSIRSAQFLTELYMPESLNYFSKKSCMYTNPKLKSIYFPGNAPTFDTSSNIEVENVLIYRDPSTTGWDAEGWGQFNFADWDPSNVEQNQGTFGDVSWNYEADKGRIIFTGSGEIPDFTQGSPAPWNAYISDIQTIEAEHVTKIGNYAFQNAVKLLRLKTGEQLQKIGDYAFADCSKLIYLDIAAVEEIGVSAFCNNSSIKECLDLEKVSSIGAGAFAGCSTLTDITLGAHLTALEENVFAGCFALSGFMIPEHVSAIGSNALKDCTSLRTINIPASVQNIGAQSFAGNTQLQKVYFYGGVPGNWAADSFINCNNSLILYYRTSQEGWSQLGDSWNNVPIQGQDQFYTEREDHYSFGNVASSFGYSPDYCIPRQRYVDVLDSIINGTYYYAINEDWRGNCFGMVSSTLEFYENSDKFRVSDFDASAENLNDLTAPKDQNAALTKLIEAYQISQYKSVGVSFYDMISKGTNNYRSLIKRVEEFERSGGLSVDSQAEPIVMLLFSKCSGHAVIPVSVDQADNGDFKIKIYDPNYPSALQTLTIYKDFSGISYKFYVYAAYMDYSAMSAAMSGVQLHESVEDNSVYISIDKEDGIVRNTEGKGIDEIEGAYEQKSFQGQEEDVFSGIRSFVLPKGDYKVAVEPSEDSENTDVSKDINETKNSTEEQGVTFYMATGNSYAKVNSSDEKAILDVKESASEAGALTIELQSESTEQEKASITLVNTDGMERTVDVTGSSATVTVAENESIAIQVPTSEAVSIDGKEVEVKDGQVESSFEAAPGENPLKAGDLDTNVSCDAQNKLSGKISATVVSNASAAQETEITAEYLDSKGKVVASYTEKKQLKPGLNTVELSFDSLAADFGESTGEVMLSCRFTVTDQAGHSAAAIAEDIKVSLIDKPGVEDPDKPGTEEPDKPGVEDPDKPGTEEPDKPGVEDPDKPGTEDPDKPGTEDPDKPGTEDPDKPGTEEPNKPGITEVEVKQVSILENNLILGVGEKIQLKAEVAPENATDKTLVFHTSNSNAEVSDTGLVTAKKVGATTVTVEAKNGKKAEVEVLVKKVPEKITLNAQSKALKPGETFQIKVTLPKDTASRSITYTSSDPSVATVSTSGKITAKKKGNAMITVQTYNGKKAQIKVEVKVDVAVRTVSLSDKKLTLGAGEKYQLNASIRPKNATDKKLTYKASGNKVKVTGKGLVTAKKPGKAAITVKAKNGKKATVTITVKKAPKKVTLNAKKKILKVGKKYQIKAKLPKGTASCKLTYTSSKKKVASVTSTGKVTAKKKGSAVITVKTFNGKKAKLKITVK